MTHKSGKFETRNHFCLLFRTGMWKNKFVKTRSTENICYRTGKYTVYRRVRPCTLQPENFTAWGGEGVNKTLNQCLSITHCPAELGAGVSGGDSEVSPFLIGRMFLREPSWKYSAKLVGSWLGQLFIVNLVGSIRRRYLRGPKSFAQHVLGTFALLDDHCLWMAESRALLWMKKKQK